MKTFTYADLIATIEAMPEPPDLFEFRVHPLGRARLRGWLPCLDEPGPFGVPVIPVRFSKACPIDFAILRHRRSPDKFLDLRNGNIFEIPEPKWPELEAPKFDTDIDDPPLRWFIW